MYNTFQIVAVALGSFCTGWLAFLAVGVGWFILLHLRHTFIKDMEC